MSKLSKSLQIFWNNQIANDNVQAAPFSGSCMFCKKLLTNKDEDHSVCNTCWANLGNDD
mgnify:CR=1 FL=1|tara:strand:+ start:1452 stop:1628 length:177 start_codon:yes stop_codon:yes gene_type:complete